jgi:glutamate synthase (NADPH) large chain
VRIELTAPPTGASACHCAMCRRWSGAAFWDVAVPADAVRRGRRGGALPLLQLCRARLVPRLWAAAEEARRARLAAEGLYRAEDEHSSCGVGLVVSMDGKPSREVVVKGIEALKAVWHRGAVDADGKTGDGAGIHVQIPVAFFYDQIRRTGHEPDAGRALIAVGQVFLPRTDFGAQERCRTIVETEVLRMGHYIYGWRHVPVNVSVLGEKANATRPEIEQILIRNAKGMDEEAFERELYVIRRRIEKAAVAAQIAGLYLCSLSCRSIIYKGMMLAEQVAEFYPDLKDERFESAFAIYHQRYSTNTFPQWWLAQPFRMLAHNGEINTLKGNVNWMKSHEIRMASRYAFGELAEDIKPIVPSGASDSGALDAVFEVLVRAGRSRADGQDHAGARGLVEAGGRDAEGPGRTCTPIATR